MAAVANGRLAQYALVIVPDLPHLAPAFAEALDQYVQGGGLLLLTGLSASASADGQPLDRLALDCAGVSAVQRRGHTPGTYFAVSAADRSRLPGLEDVDWVPLDTPWLDCTPVDGAESLLNFIPVGMFGPPEKCYYTASTDRPGLVVQRSGSGICAVLPWQIGSQYDRFPTHALSGLFYAVLEGVIGLRRAVTVEASPTVEISAHTGEDGHTLVLGLVNLSGQNGRATHVPVPVYELSFRLPGPRQAARVETLTQGDLPVQIQPDGSLTFTLPRLDLLELIRIQ